MLKERSDGRTNNNKQIPQDANISDWVRFLPKRSTRSAARISPGNSAAVVIKTSKYTDVSVLFVSSSPRSDLKNAAVVNYWGKFEPGANNTNP
jgi:hypothetical protein